MRGAVDVQQVGAAADVAEVEGRGEPQRRVVGGAERGERCVRRGREGRGVGERGRGGDCDAQVGCEREGEEGEKYGCGEVHFGGVGGALRVVVWVKKMEELELR